MQKKSPRLVPVVSRLVKTISQIQCNFEVEILPLTLSELPRGSSEIDLNKYLVIVNAITDLTVEVGQQAGVNYIFYLPANGLAGAFIPAIET